MMKSVSRGSNVTQGEEVEVPPEGDGQPCPAEHDAGEEEALKRGP